MSRDARCRVCGARYTPGYYRDHIGGLHHLRELALRDLERRLDAKKAREAAAWTEAEKREAFGK